MEQSALPNNIDQLKSIIFSLKRENSLLQIKEQQQKEVEKNILLEKEKLEEEIRRLTIEVEMLRKLKFAKKSEKWTKEDTRQALLFNEAEIDVPEKIEEEKQITIDVKPHTRSKKCGRKNINDDIPRVEKIHDIEESEKTCSCGHQRTHFGDDINERLVFIPARYYVEKNIYPKYVCRKCDKSNDGSQASVISAERKSYLMPKSIATPSLISHILISKFIDHLPLYRLEKIFRRIGVEISRKIMSLWLIIIGRKLRRILAVMRHDMMKYNHIGVDETRGQVLNEPGRKNEQKSFIWAFRGGGNSDPPILIFKYHPSRAGKVAAHFIKKCFRGTIMTDDFSGYGIFSGRQGVTRGLCWAHARRKFKDAVDIEKSPEAAKVIKMIQFLYAVEKRIKTKDMSAEKKLRMRKILSKAYLLRIRSYLDAIKTNPSSKLGQAIAYTLDNWNLLINYVDYAQMPIDNNIVENMIRPFALGRKNWLFMGSPKGALASMAHYSILQTLIANNLDPFMGMHYILVKLPYAKTWKDYEALAPHRLTHEILQKHSEQMENPPAYVKGAYRG